jgi:hypothetical protein|tara:strand:+ start:383 stop:1129 length:747 start_codon:yes stop_codon:yes gene_type:complete
MVGLTSEQTKTMEEVAEQIRLEHSCAYCSKDFTTKSGETLHINGAKHINTIVGEMEPGDPMSMSKFGNYKEVIVEAHINLAGGAAHVNVIPDEYYTTLPEDEQTRLVYDIVLQGYLEAAQAEDRAKSAKLLHMNQAKAIFGARFGLEVTEGKRGVHDVEKGRPEVLGIILGEEDASGNVPILKRVLSKRPSKIEANKLAEALLKEGIDSDKVARIIESSTTTPPPGYSWSIRSQKTNNIQTAADEDVE